MTAATTYRTCPICEAACGLALTPQADGFQIRGDKDDVLSHGFICAKGTSLDRSDSDPDRLQMPLIRDRLSGKRREASWDEAFAYAERGLRPVIECGDADAMAFYYGTGIAHSAASIYYQMLTAVLPTQNKYSTATVDQSPKHVACTLMFGHPMTVPVPDIDHCDYLLILGANPLVSNGSLFTAPGMPDRFRELKKRGGRLVVVDPARTRTAKEADVHIALRPGTDALFLAAMVHVILAENLVALGSLAPHVNGLEILRGAFKRFSPAETAAKCGIDADTIVKEARALAAARTAAVYGRIGTTCQQFGTVTSWLVDVLNVLTGNLDRRGGAMFPKAALGQANSQFRAARKPRPAWGPPTRVRGLPSIEVIGGFERPAVCLAEEIETSGTGQIRALVTYGCNPVLSIPDGPRLSRALEKIGFMVSVDPYLNETTRHADVILPPPGDLARFHYPFAMLQWSSRNAAKWSGRSRPLMDKERCDQEILLRLISIVRGQGSDADIGALDDQIFEGLFNRLTASVESECGPVDRQKVRDELNVRWGVERLCDLQLRAGPYGDKFGHDAVGLSLSKLEQHPHGIDLGPLEPRIPEILLTASQKIELAPVELVADLDRLAKHMHRPDEGLVLIGRRDPRSHNSWMHNIESLASGKPRCTLQVHPEDARMRGLADHSMVRLSSDLASIDVDLEITEAIRQGVVSLPHGWGHAEADTGLSRARRSPGVNCNAIIAGNLFDPLSGNAAFNGVPVTLKNIPAGADLQG